ncbi:MAG: hypothetical protein ACFFCS_01415 [Candidatus Hodarchaeota archaeon]
MTIEIDDAGTGDPLLGAVIGFYRQETDESPGELHFEWIPIETYQEGTFQKGLPQEEAAKAVMRGLLVMNRKEDELIYLCQGSIFDKARESLDKANIKYEPLKVEGVLQEAVEEEYIKAVEKLGIRSKFLRVDEDNKDKGYRKRWHILLNWARKKPAEREKYVKNALNFWKYKKDQSKPIPGGWKKARKDFEEKLEGILAGNKEGLTWKKLSGILKENFTKDGVWINQTISFHQGAHNHRNNVSGPSIQLYNSVLNQLYFFIGQDFNENPRDATWKAVAWHDYSQTVNGIIFYVNKDKQYRSNMKWLNLMRDPMRKILGSHLRFVTHPF